MQRCLGALGAKRKLTGQNVWVASVLYLLPIREPAPFMEKAITAAVICIAALLWLGGFEITVQLPQSCCKGGP